MLNEVKSRRAGKKLLNPEMHTTEWVTVDQFAALTGRTVRVINFLCRAGKVVAKQVHSAGIGWYWLINVAQSRPQDFLALAGPSDNPPFCPTCLAPLPPLHSPQRSELHHAASAVSDQEATAAPGPSQLTALPPALPVNVDSSTP
jgi:hypothetical protein